MQLVYAAAAILGVMYLVSPLVIRAMLKFNARPTLQGIPVEAMPPEVYVHFGETAPGLSACGFRLITYLCIPNQMPGATAFVALWDNASRGHIAMAAVLYASNAQTTSVRCHTEFMTKLLGGLEILTSNTKNVGVFKRYPQKDVLSVRGEMDLTVLYNIHLVRDAKLANPREPRYLPAEGEEIQSLQEGMQYDMQRQAELGYFYDAGDGFYRPTLIGAFAMTWKELPPMKQIRRWRMDRRARAALAETRMNGGGKGRQVSITHESPYGRSQGTLVCGRG
jgi:hypothetical protein